MGMWTTWQSRKSLWPGAVGFIILFLGAAGTFKLPQIQLVNTVMIFIGVFILTEGLFRCGVEKHIASDADDIGREKATQELQIAKWRILITSGNLNSNLYVDWNKGKIREIIQTKLEEGVEIEIISGANIDSRSLTMFKELGCRHPNLRLYIYPGNPEPHGTLVDDKFLRLEEQHRPGDATHKAIYVKKPGIGGSWFLAMFDKYKSQAGNPIVKG
jgi:hypothetical protein